MCVWPPSAVCYDVVYPSDAMMIGLQSVQEKQVRASKIGWRDDVRRVGKLHMV